MNTYRPFFPAVLLSGLFSCLITLFPGRAAALPVIDTLPADSLLLRQPAFFPGLAPAMVGEGQVEGLFFNSLSTQKLDFTQNNVTERSRSTTLLHYLQLTYGLTANRRLNAGIDISYLHARSDSDEGSSPFAVLGGDSQTGTAYHTFAAAGLHLRGIPVATLPELMVQTTLLFPVAGQDLPRLSLDVARTQWLVQGTFYQQFRPWLYGFVSLTGSVKFKNAVHRQTTYAVPVNLYLIGEVVRKKLFVYPSLSYAANYEKQFKGSLKQRNYQLLGGLGAQYYPSSRLQVNLEWQGLLSQDLNLTAVEAVPGSYATLNLSLRYVMGR